MLNFTVGPVMSHKEILEVSGMHTPYFRTSEFSDIMFENEEMMLKYLNAPEDSKCVFLTTSGTGGMEACVSGLLTKNDKVAVVNGGTFGHRFVELCKLHAIPYIEVGCEFGYQIRKEDLSKLDDEGITALLVNMDETSSGLLYDMKRISEYCQRKSIFLIVDAISSFLADEFDMKSLSANAVIVASQKALALQPGIAIITLDRVALDRVNSSDNKIMYLNLKDSLENMKRGQTPFTPAVNVLLQLNRRLRMIEAEGGAIYEINKTRKLAEYFRNHISAYPFNMLICDACNRSNAVTALVTENNNAGVICEELKTRFNIWICPNGGLYNDSTFRVGHIGAISETDYDVLFDAFDTMRKEGIL